MTLHVWTMQMGRRWQAADEGIELLDTTAKSGHRHFAPEYEMVMQYKLGRLTEAQYEGLYRQRMSASMARFPHLWENLLTKKRIGVACYCAADAFCHRHIFTNILQNYCVQKGVTMVLEGELRAPKKD